MQLIFHTGTAGFQLALLQKLMAKKRKKLLEQGLLLPASAGQEDHVLPFLLGTAQTGWHPYRSARGFSDLQALEASGAKWIDDTCKEIAAYRPRALILTMREMWNWCDSPKSLGHFIEALSVFSDDIHAVVHLARPEDALYQRFLWQVGMGRQNGLSREEHVAAQENGWWGAAHEQRKSGSRGAQDISTPFPALGQADMLKLWREALDPTCLTVRPLPDDFTHESLLEEFRAAFDLKARVGKVDDSFRLTTRPTAGRAALARRLRMNQEIARIEATEKLGHVPLQIRHQAFAAVPAPENDVPLTPADFAPLVRGIDTEGMFPTPDARPEFEALEPDDDYDPAPQLVGFKEAVRARQQEVRERQERHRSRLAKAKKRAEERGTDGLSKDGARLLKNGALEVLESFRDSRFAPRNTGIVTIDESQDMPPLPIEPLAPKTGTLVIGCMKDEAPYILEWVAYHKSIGVDHFLIFTNDCSDGTDAMLDRLAELGHVTHERNDEWKGKSPQQAALNKAMNMEVLQQATWLIHIDVDEFINIRFGNGTLAEVYASDPDATNLAMTWRVFGNAGIEDVGDASVIHRFTKCAPAFAPKPHTMWGFKSITKNVGIYGKLSCHRPNKPVDAPPVRPKWLNGSLKDMTAEGTKPGTWRSSMRSVGYDMVQLNHYALRSRDSFIVKRKRGRALHTDRSIGLNYWVRHDWNTHGDRTILRHVDRMQHEKAQLLADPKLAELHHKGLEWHRSKVAELAELADFQKLRNETMQADLTDLERVAYSVTADMES